MDTIGIFYALLTVLAWGTWLAPSQNVEMRGQQTRTFYVTLAVLLMSLVFAFFIGIDSLNAHTFWFPFIGGIIWTLSGWSAFAGTEKIGMAKAFGIWAPLNIVVSIIWGGILFNEFSNLGSQKIMLMVGTFSLIVIGLLFIIFAGSGNDSKKLNIPGLFAAFGAGIGFASYFIPIQIGTANYPDFNMWIGTFPMAIGMFTASSILMVLTKSSPRLKRKSDYFRIISTGLLWGIGNYGALAMMERIGTGKGFTIAQLCVVVNALVGIFILKDPNPKSRAAKLTIVGVVLAMIGGILLGNIK